MSHGLRIESLKARVEIQKCEFKSTSSNSGVTSSTLRVQIHECQNHLFNENNLKISTFP